MQRYDEDFRPRRPPAARRRARIGYRWGGSGERVRPGYGDGARFGYALEEYGQRRTRPDSPRLARLPMKPARGFPVRGFHSYDLDYGRQAGGPTTEYSGRVGYSEIPGRGVRWGRYTSWFEAPPESVSYPPRHEERHWSAAEPVWSRGSARGYAPGYDPRRCGTARVDRSDWHGYAHGYRLPWPG